MDEEKFANDLIRHELAAQKLNAGEAAKITRMLNATIEDMKSELAVRYAKAQARGVDRGPATTKRIEDMIAGLESLNTNVYSKIGKTLEDGLVDRARHETQFVRDANKKAGGVNLSTTLPDTNYFRTLVNHTPIAIDSDTSTLLKPWLRDMERNNLDRLNRVVQSALIAGKTPAELGDLLEKGGFAKSRASAQALAITANSAVANRARLDTFKQMKGITHVEWSSILDSRTSPTCQSLSGKIFAIDEPHPVPPAHIRCRSTLLPRKNDTAPPLHKPYSEWLKSQDSRVQDEVLGKARGEAFRKGDVTTADIYRDDGGFKTLDELKRQDANIVAPEPTAKRFTSPTKVDLADIRVQPRKDVTKALTSDLAQAAKDARYDPRPEFKGIKEADLGRATLSAGFTDPAASMIAALKPELDQMADAFGIPRLRSVKTGNGKYIATMGDGTLTVNPTYFNGYAAILSGEEGGSAAAKIVAQRDAIAGELTEMKAKIEAAKAVARDATGAAREAAVLEYVDLADTFNKRRQDWLKLDKKVLAARRTDAASSKPVSSWKPGDEVASRPYNSTDYFSGVDRARNVLYHEFAHHIHQMLGKRGRRSQVGKPPLEKQLSVMFFNKFNGAAPGNLGKGLERKKLVASTYATTNEFEWFAENFALHMMGRHDLVETELKELIERILEEVNGAK